MIVLYVKPNSPIAPYGDVVCAFNNHIVSTAIQKYTMLANLDIYLLNHLKDIHSSTMHSLAAQLHNGGKLFHKVLFSGQALKKTECIPLFLKMTVVFDIYSVVINIVHPS